jgi:hypothetical protein
MTISQKIYFGIGLCLVCGVALKSAETPASKTNWHLIDPAAAPTTVAQTTTVPAQPAASPAVGSQGPKLASIAEPPRSAPDGKETIGDGKEVIPPDGKEVIPTDGKETLPAVGQLLPSGRPSAVDPANAGPPTEYLNRNVENNNPLLTSPNPQNVAGPVVSAETR